MKKLLILLSGICLSVLVLGVPLFTWSGNFGFGTFDSVTNTKDIQVGGAANGGNSFRDEQFLSLVRGAVNWILGLLALIALILLIYGGFLMVTAAGDEEKYKKGFAILRAAAIGLTLIGVAWMIASLIFWLTVVTGQAAEGTTAGTDQ